MNMKKILNTALLIFAASLLFVACKDDKNEPVPFAYENTTVAAFTYPQEGEVIELTKDQAGEMLELTWIPAVYSANDGTNLGAPVYSVSVMVGELGGVVATTTDVGYAIKIGDLNEMLYKFEIPFGQNDLKWTITASLPNYEGSLVESSVNTKVTTYDPTTVELITAATIVEPTEGAVFVLDETMATDTIDVSWTAAVYEALDGHALADVEYVMSIIANEDTSEIVTTTDLSTILTVEGLNSTLKVMGLEAGVETDVVWTLKSMIPDEIGTDDVVSVNTKVTVYDPAPPSNLWVPGAYQGWSPAEAPMVYETDVVGVFSGYVNFNGEDPNFKFTAQPNWDGPNYGTDGTEWGLDTDAGAGNLSVVDMGNYWLTCNTVDLVWEKELRTFGLVGTFNGWGGEPDAELTFDETNRMFTVTMDFEAATQFKWRANSDWAVNFGESGAGDNTLSQDGANIVLDEAGNYTINLYLEKQVPTYEVIKN